MTQRSIYRTITTAKTTLKAAGKTYEFEAPDTNEYAAALQSYAAGIQAVSGAKVEIGETTKDTVKYGMTPEVFMQHAKIVKEKDEV